MLIALNGWSRSLLLIGLAMMLLIFEICRVVSGWFAVTITLLHGNSLDLVMTDVPDIVDVFVDTHWEILITPLPAVCFGLSNLYRSTISEVQSF